jgi:hypothetical protein
VWNGMVGWAGWVWTARWDGERLAAVLERWRCGAVWWDRMAAVGSGADGRYVREEHRGGLGWAVLGWSATQTPRC